MTNSTNNTRRGPGAHAHAAAASGTFQNKAIPPALQKFIDTRDRRIAKSQPWSPTPLAEAFQRLLDDGAVTMGGRASCGGRVDPTWTTFTYWGEVVSKAKRLGFDIEEENIPQKNASPTRSGGFWNESRYRLRAAVVAGGGA